MFQESTRRQDQIRFGQYVLELIQVEELFYN